MLLRTHCSPACAHLRRHNDSSVTPFPCPAECSISRAFDLGRSTIQQRRGTLRQGLTEPLSVNLPTSWGGQRNSHTEHCHSKRFLFFDTQRVVKRDALGEAPRLSCGDPSPPCAGRGSGLRSASVAASPAGRSGADLRRCEALGAARSSDSRVYADGPDSTLARPSADTCWGGT